MITFPSKPAPADCPIPAEIRDRWSPLAFSGRPVEEEKIRAMFEAARWAPSSFNEQPWRFLYATKDDGNRRAALESLLAEGNAWAKEAYILLVSFAKTAFARNGKENRHAFHDTGCANGYLLLSLAPLGLIGHSMAGFDWQGANAALGVPEGFVAVAMTVVGYPGDPAALTPELRVREEAPRERIPQSSFVFRGSWPKS